MKVLIVDDNANDRKLLRYTLEREGCDAVVEGRDGLEGLELAKAHLPDLIISDAMMPGMDGFAFLRAVKTDPELKAIPFVFHSSVYTAARDEELALSLGAEAFIAKPKEPHEFWRELSAILDRIAAGVKKPPPPLPLEGGEEYLRRYSGVVAAKLEEKVRELEEALARRKEAEEALRESGETMRAITDTAADAIAMIDGDGLVTYWNPAAARIFGYTSEEATGRDLHLLLAPERYHDDYARGFAHFRETGCGPVIGKRLEKAALRKGGKEIPVELSVSAVYLQGKWHAMGIIRDISERKQAEEERKALEAQLRHAQKMEAIGLLAGGISHDFNNVLQVIIGYAGLLQMRMKEDDQSRQHLEQLHAAAERAAGLTRSLLAFSRTQIINPKLVNLNDIVMQTEKFLARVIGEDIDIQTTLTEELLFVNADRGQIEQVLMNLATNARDAMPHGGLFSVRSEIATIDQEYVDVHGYGEPGRYALLTLSDTGEGMDAATVERIFEPFFTTKEMGRGTGLGLSIVYGIVKQHNGYVNVESEPGRGTTFRIYLPLVKGRQPGEEEKAPPPPAPGGSETILVAEDDEAARELTKAILAESGYEVIEAIDGEDAVRKFIENRGKVRLLLLDMILPKKNGSDVCAAVRKMEPAAKIVFVSGYPADFVRRSGMLEQGMELLMKPVSPQELLRKVREVLDRKGAV